MTEPFYKLNQNLAARKDLHASDKLVCAVIDNYQSKNDFAFPGITTLMRCTGLARQTVIDAIKRLEKAGDIQVKRQGNGKKNLYKTSLNNRPVQKLDQSKRQTISGLKPRPKAVQKLDPNKKILKKRINNIYCQTSIEFKLAELLLKHILKRKSDYKKPDLQSWAKHIDLMIRIDNRKPEQIEKVINWCQGDTFWQNNILSTVKLRKHFDRLELQIERKSHGCDKTQQERNFDGLQSNIGQAFAI